MSERNFTVTELLQLVKTHEAVLSGTAACLSPVGTLVYRGKEIKVRDGNAGPNAAKLAQGPAGHPIRTRTGHARVVNASRLDRFREAIVVLRLIDIAVKHHRNASEQQTSFLRDRDARVGSTR